MEAELDLGALLLTFFFNRRHFVNYCFRISIKRNRLLNLKIGLCHHNAENNG
jgi:hypothetical protein